MDSYVTVQGPAIAEFVEKRSRFIGEIRPVCSEQEAADFIAEKKSRHWDASHNCSAYILKGGVVQRYSDDGEPQGTAGMPMLEVLRREGLQDCAVVVTRYFGGILLGAGGLVRAYTHGAKIAVDAAVRAEICRCTVFSLSIPYALYDRVNLLVEESRAVVLGTDFATDVAMTARLQAASYGEFVRRLTELSSGTIAPQVLEDVFAPVPVVQNVEPSP